MTAPATPQIAVVIPAHNAAATIGIAVQSALIQPEVSEVIVVDDASIDTTGDAARLAASGDTRLKVVRQKQNVGPAQGRNIAIAQSNAPYIALLDADDYLLPGRFAPMFAHDGWDVIADNIVFVPEHLAAYLTTDDVDQPRTAKADLIDTTMFLLRNIPDGKSYRGELGFLKPVMSRAFLDRHCLQYDPTLRLGEDFKLYVELLSAGARFELLSCVGYVARVRTESLSGAHSADDLRNLMSASMDLKAIVGDTADVRRAMRQYLRALRKRFLLHDFLEFKNRNGMARAVLHAFTPPGNALPILSGVLRDKLIATTKNPRATIAPKRYLFPVE